MLKKSKNSEKVKCVVLSSSTSPPILRKLSSQNASQRYRSIAISSGRIETEFEDSIFDSGLLTPITIAISSTAPLSSSMITTHIIDYGLSNEANEYDDFEIDYLENRDYTDDKTKAEVARYNLATRVMSNGVEVIIAGDKSKTVEQNNIIIDNTNNIILNTQKSNILRILQSQSQKPMTLAASTLQDQMILVEPSNLQENYAIPIDTNQFITKTCLTTYTYRTTYLQNGQTTVESREKIISNIATEERNYLKLSSTLSLGVTLSRTPEFAVGVFPTTYIYYNTIFDGELPIVMTSKHTLSNTITGPNDYISLIQPSEIATPVQKTNTYYKKVTFTKTWRDTDSSQQIVSTASILTQIVVTESLPSRSTSAMTSYFAYDSFDTSQEYLRPQNHPDAVKSIATEPLLSLPIYHSSPVEQEATTSLLPTPHSKSKNEGTSLITTLPQLLPSKLDNNLHIYATKTFLTTFTYFTTTLLKSPAPANLVMASTQDSVLTSSTIVNYHTRVIENVIAETIPSSLLGPNLLSRFYVELKKSKNQRKVIVTQATLNGGQTLEITAMNIPKPETIASAFAASHTSTVKQQQSVTVGKTTKQPLNATKVHKVSTFNSNLKIPTTTTAPATNHNIEANEIDAADDEDSVVASSEQEAAYVSGIAEQPSKPTKAINPITSSPAFSNNEHTKVNQPAGKPPNSSNLPGAVNNIIGSFNIQRLTALRPVFNAMAGLLNSNFGISATADDLKYTTAKHPASHLLQSENKNAHKNISASNNYEALPVKVGYSSNADRPIYIPVQNLVAVSAAQQLSNFPNATLAYHDDMSLNPSQLTPPQSLHIQPPAADIVLSNENWLQEAASKLILSANRNNAADLKSHKSASAFQTPLLNGGIPISPGEVITTNSDVIIGRPNGIQHPRVPLNSKSVEISHAPHQLVNDNNVAATSHALSQPADLPYTTFYQHFIQHPHPLPYKEKSAFKEQLQITIPISAQFNESILRPPPFFPSNEHQSPPGIHAKTYGASPPSYIQLPPPPPAQMHRPKINQQQRLQQYLSYIPQGYSETKYFSRLPAELHKIFNINKELQNNEILEIKRIPEVFSTDLPPETEFTATYLTTQRPLEFSIKHTGDVVQLGHSSSPNLLTNVQPTRLTNIVIPPQDNAASALVVASTTSMLYNHNKEQYYDASNTNTGTSTFTPIHNAQPSINHQKINFDTHDFSHNVNINVPPLTFKKDADEFPPSSAPVLGQISTNQMDVPLNLHKMPLVKIPLSEAQIQVELTPQRFIGSVHEPSHLPGGINKQTQTHQLTTDNSAIGSFALEPQFKRTPPTTSQQQHKLVNKPEGHRINNNKNNNNQFYSTHVTIQENPFSMEMNKVSSIAAANNFGLKLEQSYPILSSLPPIIMESHPSSSNFGFRSKPLGAGADAYQSAAEYTIRSQPYPPHNIEEAPTYQQFIKPNSHRKKQRRPSLGPLLPNMNVNHNSYPPTTTHKTTAVSKLTTPPNYTRKSQQTSADNYWNHNLVTDDNETNDDVPAASMYTTSIHDQKVEASFNSLRLPQQQHKESVNAGVKPLRNTWPFLDDMVIRGVNNMSNLVTTPSPHFSTFLPTKYSNKTRNSENDNQWHKIPSHGKPFEATTQTKTTSFPERHQRPQQVFITSGEGFKHKVSIYETTSNTHEVTSKYADKVITPSSLSNDGDEEIFDYNETSNPQNFESVNTTVNFVDTDNSTISKAVTATTAHNIRPIKDNSNNVTSPTTRNNKNNALYHMLNPVSYIRPPSVMLGQQFHSNEPVVGLSPPPPQQQTPATSFSLPTIPYKTINYTSSNNEIQRLELQPPPLPKLNQYINSKAPNLASNSRQPGKPPTLFKPPEVLPSNLSPPTPTKTYNNGIPQLMPTPMLDSTLFAENKVKSTTQRGKSTQQLHTIKVTAITTRTSTKSNSVIPSELLFSSNGAQNNNVKSQNRANTQLLSRLPTKQFIIPTKIVTNTQVLTVTTTKTTVLTVAGKQSTKTLTLTKTQTATILDTVTKIHTLLQPTRVTESHIILATTTIPVHVPVSTHNSNDHNQYDLGDLSNHKPYENHTHKSAFDVSETKFSGTAHPSVEVVLPEVEIFQKQQHVTTERTNSTSKTGSKKGIINISPTVLKSAHEINGISAISTDVTSSGAGVTAGDTTGTYIADSDVALDYYDNVSFDFPTLDEEYAPNVNKANHVLLGGVLIATPPKSSSSPRKPIDSSKTKQNANEVQPDQNNSVSFVGSSSNPICRPSCKAQRNELCMRVQTSTRCICRPGFARMFPDRPCKPTYTYAMQIRLDRLGKDLLNFEEHLPNNESKEFRQLAAIAHDAIDRMVMQSDFRDVYHGVHLSSIEAPKRQGGIDTTEGNETVANFLLQLSDNSDEKRLVNVFKKYLRQSNYSIGGTELYTTKNGVESMAVVDFDECIHSKFHDCSENARCFNLQGTYTCSCQEGYADLSDNPIYPGRLCSAEMIGCEKCHYHGTCVTSTKNNNKNNNNNNKQTGTVDKNTPICECFSWYTGATCQLNLKILLIALIAIGILLFILLLFCILVTCTKRNRHPSARSLLASSVHKLAVKNIGLAPTAVGGMRSKNLKIDKRAMIKDSSSETSQNSLPYVLKERTVSIKKQQVHNFPANIYYDGSHHKHSSSLQMVHNHGSEQFGIVSSTLIAALEDPSNELQHYPEQSDRSLTVMIPRAKYHSTVLPSTQLLHHQLTMERMPHFQNKTTANMANPTIGGGSDDMYANSDAEHMQLSSNAMSVDPKKSANTKKRTSVSSQRNGDTSNTSVGALVSAGFEVSATVGDKLLNNSSYTLNSSSNTSNDRVDVHNGDGNTKHLHDNVSTDSDGVMPAVCANTGVYNAALGSSASEMHHHQILPNYMTEMHLRGAKTEISDTHDSEYNTNYKDSEDLIHSMDVWLDTMHQTELATEVRSFDETTVNAPTKSIQGCFDNHNSQPNDEANTMAERDVGSTFLLPHTHLYKPDRQESDMSGFDSV